MDSIAITLNGIPVSGRPGMTILELAREAGVKIPTLCHDSSLHPVGACRICLVEEEKSGRLLASCVTPIAAGMSINTESPAVVENRKVIVELMLASHPESCLLCDKGNRCRLRGIAAELGVGALDYYRMPQFTGTEEVNPFIFRDLSKCILCAKCIRADHELVVVGALDYMHRGFEAIPATTFNGPLEASECTFCGTCVSMCPTGALSERGRPHLGTIAERTPGVCSYCGCGCNIFLETAEGRLVSVSPRGTDDLNGKTLCVKGRYGSDYIHHPDRLAKPLIRREGELREAEWDEALDFVAEGLRNCHSHYGPERLAFFGSSKCTNEETYLFQKMARAVFGTNNIDNGSRIHSGPSVEALPFGAMTNPLQDIERSDAIVVVGSNPSASHPVAGYAIKRAAHRGDARLIVIDPVKIDLAAFASTWFPIRPGMDAVFLNGILRALLDSRAFDKNFADNGGLERWRESLAPFGRRNVLERTGCPPSAFESIVDTLAEARRPAFVYGRGITRQAAPREAIHAIMNLALLKGSLGQAGGGIYPLDKENNGQGAWDMGCAPDRLPGHLPLDDREKVKRFETRWGRPVPDKPGVNALGMILGAESGDIKAMYVMGENPVRSFPDSPRVEKALAGLEFLVVQDLFLTETARHAHAVLPACSFAEKDGTHTNIERRVQRIRRAIEPFRQARPDWEILRDLSNRLGYPAEYGSADEVTREIAALAPHYGGILPERLEKGGLFWPCPDAESDGRSRLPAMERSNAAQFVPGPENDEADDALLLLRGSTLFHFLGGTRSSRSRRIEKMAPATAGSVGMNPADAEKLGLAEGDSVELCGPRAKVSTTVALNGSLPPGVLFCPRCDLTAAPLFSLTPGNGSMCRVRIKKR